MNSASIDVLSIQSQLQSTEFQIRRFEFDSVLPGNEFVIVVSMRSTGGTHRC